MSAASATVHHGDCVEWLGTLPDGCADAVVTDPPYGIGFASRPTKWQRRAGMQSRDWDDLTACLEGVFRLAPRVCIWGGNYYNLEPSRGWLVWYKPDAPPSMAAAELCWTNLNQNTRLYQHSISATNKERVGHPTQKPLALMKWCLDAVGVPPGGLVVDPFAGSGTTGVACVETGRRFLGCEIDENYCALARRRIASATPSLFGVAAGGGA